MAKTVDVYMPLDARAEPNREVWPIARKQLGELVRVIEKCGWKANVLNPGGPVSSVAQGIRTVRDARGDRFLNFIGGWAYPDFSVSPMFQLSRDVPKLMVGSCLSDYPGAVGLLAAAAGTAQVGVATSRCFVERFDQHADYSDAIEEFLEKGSYAPPQPRPIDIPVGPKAAGAARKVREPPRG